MAELIQGTDSLNAGRIKINEAITQSNQAIDIANNTMNSVGEAVDTANQALSNSEDTQNQLNTIVINGDSSVEAAQARVASDGITAYATLKERLDTEYNDVNNKIGNITINIKKYGAAGNGDTDDYVSFNSCFLDIGSKQVDLIIPNGTYVIGTNITIPANFNLVFENGAMLSPSSGVIITINGGICAGLYQIFAGNGSFNGKPKINTVQSIWFGVPIVDGLDAQPSLQKAINFIQSETNQVGSGFCDTLELYPNSRILLSTQLIVKQGKNTSSGVALSLNLNGNNATIFPNVDTYGIYIMPVCESINAGKGWGISNVNIKNLTFDNFYGVYNSFVNCKALRIGRTGYSFNGFKNSKFENILFKGFNDHALYITNVRNITFDNIHSRDGGGISILSGTSNFTGDMTFRNCEFIGSEINRPLKIYCYSGTTAAADIRGLRFTDCVIYGGGTLIEASGTSIIGDIWFNNCAWDQGANTETAITIKCGDTSQMFNIFFNCPYITNYGGNGVSMIGYGSNISVGNVQFNGGTMGLISGSDFTITNFSKFRINNVSMGSGGTYGINVAACSGFKILGTHIAKSDSDMTYSINVDSSCNNYTICNNSADMPIRDLGGVSKVVANNLTLV